MGSALTVLWERATGYEVYLSLAVSLCILVALVVLLVSCVTCCKGQEINFKEFEDHFEDDLDFTPPAEDTPSMHSSAEVYTLAVPPIALPGPPHLQLLTTTQATGLQVARHRLSYIQEIGSGWFGKVLLGEIYSDPGVARVVVKELKANACAKEQNDFLQQADPYRVLQHPNILQCLAQCMEAIPFLSVFEYCELGDLKSYLVQQDRMLLSTDLLQKMACEIAAGVTHLHKNNFLHSDLALRNCFVSADLTVKIGDYGIGPSKYKEDYISTKEEIYVPLRWMAPELVSELHGALITEDQTKPGNVWALGVTLWELLASAAQPYAHLSDREVLIHVIKEQQVTLSEPQLELPYSDRWYEVLQFCWLPADRRATAEEVHRLLTYLRMQGQRDMEEDFEQRWNALKPNPANRQATTSQSYFPILKPFVDGGMDEVLTVTETSQGLSFEYVWEAAEHDHYGQGHTGQDTTLNYRSMFFPVSQYNKSVLSSPGADVDNQSVSMGVPGIQSMIEAEELDTTKEHYIQLEEQGNGKEVSDTGDIPDPSEKLELSHVNKQKYLVLHNSRLGESSTDIDFFRSSVDSKDSNAQEGQEWSSSDLESPYRTSLFCETSSKNYDSDSWSRSVLELPNISTKSWASDGENSLERGDLQKRESFSSLFQGEDLEAFYSENTERNSNSTNLLSTERLMDNFLFLKEKSLMKDGPCLSEGHQDLGEDVSAAGLSSSPENHYKFSGDKDEIVSGEHKTVSILESADNSVSPKDKLLNFLNLDLNDLEISESLVPSSTLVAGENFNDQLQLNVCSSSEDHVLLHSSESGIDFVYDFSTSQLPESPEVPVCSTNNQSPESCYSANKDIVCTVAKTSNVVESLETSQGDMYWAGVKPSENHRQGSPPLKDVKDLLASDVKHTNNLVSNTFREVSNGTDTASFEVPQTNDSSVDDPFLRLTRYLPSDKSEVQISESQLNERSQDNHLDSSTPNTLSVGSTVGTPDSLDSLDLPEAVHPAEALSSTGPQRLQISYKTADSGYETENLESPEWNSQTVLQDAHAERSTQDFGQPLMVMQSPPDIVVSVADCVQDPQKNGVDVAQEQPLIPSDVELHCGGNQSYRDSAYFSDNDLEPDKILSDSTLEFGSSPALTMLLTRVVEKEEQLEEVPADVQTESTEATYVQEESNSMLVKSNGAPDLVIEENWDKEASLSISDTKKVALSETRSGLTARLNDSTSECESTKDSISSAMSNSSEDNVAPSKLISSSAGESTRLKEPDVEGRYLGKLDNLAVPGRLEDDTDADEEDDDDSDDWENDMGVYRQHSCSSESEDDTVDRVPIIITDSSEVCSLRSLLKKTSACTGKPSHLGSGNSVQQMKTVSFFDDVTVYLFDQDTPTKELSDHLLESSEPVPESSIPVSPFNYLGRFTNSESSTDEEGGGFEWDDDFALAEPSFHNRVANNRSASKMAPSGASRSFPPPPAVRTAEQSWTDASTYSRFSISPVSIASFSLTHLTDSDMEQGGSSEDGEKD
ncbi:serine/threonine-protein kinase LMTK2 isoform X2 [Scleropages formosus]|uniref:non-specific serine/threonine protein kinase n=1 Tax=Scleropages formosus TaxID=113540 RepID=A0A8C9SLL2_SCLFO|nr:serine/threonine-protein kinase LMTK2 isoform X2 [Scleropages formosus]